MDIPDEAWIAAHSVADADLDEVVRAAAPHIARSAQVAVLREMYARLNSAMLELDPIPQQIYAVYRDVMLDLATSWRLAQARRQPRGRTDMSEQEISNEDYDEVQHIADDHNISMSQAQRVLATRREFARRRPEILARNRAARGE